MFAHQGGWDEMLYAAIPIGLIFMLLRLANSRAKRQMSNKASESIDYKLPGSDVFGDSDIGD